MAGGSGVTAAATISTNARVISSTSGPILGAEKRGRGQIERELLHRRIEQHRPGLRLPLRDPRRDPGIERGEIGFHRSGFERDRQRAPVQAMLVEIEQHQAARKQPAQDHLPAVGRGEQPALVEQHQLIGLRPEQGDAGFAEHAAAIDQTVFGGHSFDFAFGVGEDRQRPADDRPALVARNMFQRIALGRREGDRGGNHSLHGHGNCSDWSHDPPERDHGVIASPGRCHRRSPRCQNSRFVVAVQSVLTTARRPAGNSLALTAVLVRPSVSRLPSADPAR